MNALTLLLVAWTALAVANARALAAVCAKVGRRVCSLLGHFRTGRTIGPDHAPTYPPREVALFWCDRCLYFVQSGILDEWRDAEWWRYFHDASEHEL